MLGITSRQPLQTYCLVLFEFIIYKDLNTRQIEVYASDNEASYEREQQTYTEAGTDIRRCSYYWFKIDCVWLTRYFLVSELLTYAWVLMQNTFEV